MLERIDDMLRAGRIVVSAQVMLGDEDSSRTALELLEAEGEDGDRAVRSWVGSL